MSDGPHPLARELAVAIGSTDAGRRVLVLGIGSGRNVPPLLDAGLRVDAIENDATRARDAATRFAADARVRVVRASYGGPLPVGFGFDGVLSTHALLHGTPNDVARAVHAAANRTRAGGLLFATLGCVDDPRFGTGTRIDAATFAPQSGAEAGVPHAYFRDDELARALAPFELERYERVDAGDVVGRWAHGDGERVVHWFVRARRP